MKTSLRERMAEVMDMDQVDELRSIPGEGEMDLFADVAGLFLRTTPKLLAELEKAIQEGEVEGVAKRAHMLKGSASNLGAFRLSEKSHLLEQAAQQGRSDLKNFFTGVSEDYGILRLILNEVLAEPPEA